MSPNLEVCAKCQSYREDPEFKLRRKTGMVWIYYYCGVLDKREGGESKLGHRVDGLLVMNERFQVPEKECPYKLEHLVSL